jgi:FkbM family methyltransferase
MTPLARLRSLFKNTILLGPLMGHGKAVHYLLTTRGQPDALGHAQYKGIPFSFRRRDISAVREILQQGEYRFLAPLIANTDKPVILDIGAHIGLFSIWALSINPKAIIHCIEASPDTYKILSQNIRENLTKGFSWSAEHRAAWNVAGEISFTDNAESSMSHRITTDGNTKISTITFLELIQKVGKDTRTTLIKIDIEGAEESFLCKGNASFENIGNIAIEIHPALCNTDNVVHLLRQSFSVENVKQDDPTSKPLLYCRKAA